MSFIDSLLRIVTKMPLNLASISFTMTKWILTVVFMTSTLLMVFVGAVNFFYGIKFIREVSGYDKPNGAILIVYGAAAIIYGAVMYFVIKKYNPEVWIEAFVVISIVVLTVLMISGVQGLSTGSSMSNYNIAHYLRLLYLARSDYTKSVLAEVHQYYECCGLYGNRTFVQIVNGSAGWNCCPKSEESCLVSRSFKLGCEEPISQFHNTSVYSLGSVWMAIGTVYLVMVFLAFYYQKMYTNRPN